VSIAANHEISTVQGIGRSVLGAVLSLTLLSGWVYGLLVGDYVEWLRFSSPRAPNPATGQVIYLKMAKGVFFATSAQVQLLRSPLLVAPAMVAAIILFKVMKLESDSKSAGDEAKSNIFGTIFAIAFFGIIFALMFFGDHIMQLIFAGSLDLPPENHTRVLAIPAD
jgi:hypothetical protein